MMNEKEKICFNTGQSLLQEKKVDDEVFMLMDLVSQDDEDLFKCTSCHLDMFKLYIFIYPVESPIDK